MNQNELTNLPPRYTNRAATKFTGGCRWCNQEITSPRRRTFCSAACVHEYKLRSNGNYLRECVYARDKGVCKGCGYDTKQLANTLYMMTHQVKRTRVPIPAQESEYWNMRMEYNISKNRRVWKSKYGGGLWDADHINPVSNGGGCTGIDNLRTLCCACHRSVTWSGNAAKKSV